MTLNKMIISGLFILVLIQCFHQNISESFVSSNEGKTMHSMFKNEFTDLNKKKNNGSGEYINKLLYTVSAHLENLHVEKTIDLIRKNSYVKVDDDAKPIVDFTPLNDGQVKQLEHIQHIGKLNKAIRNSIHYNNSIPTGRNILKNIFG
jgi:hypothetical protein